MTRVCKGCSGEIPSTRAAQARYCSEACKTRHNNKLNRNSEATKKAKRTHAKKVYHRDPEKAKAQSKAWRTANLDRVQQYERERYQTQKYGIVLEDMTYKNARATMRGALSGYRSGLEDEISDQIAAAGHPVLYEVDKLSYSVPQRNAKYTPDFKLFRRDGSTFYVETKGYFETKDRQKHILLKEQGAPEVRFVFSRSATKISKNSPTTYAKWCVDKGFKFADKRIPAAWFKE
jgi:hypothetical protein